MAIEKVDKIWLDGGMVDWDAAQTHVLTHTLHYGLGAFEGIRCYRRNDGRSAVFRLDDHLERLRESCHIATLDLRFSREELHSACVELLQENHLSEAYIRPIVYLGSKSLGLGTLENPSVVAIGAYEWKNLIGPEATRKGIRAKVSSFTRSGVNSLMSKGKLCGGYINSVLAKREVLAAGYDEAILLDDNGHVAEASGENVFIVKRGVLKTPPSSSPILAGITRDSVLQIARDRGMPVEETVFPRDEMWCADEVFLTGTAAEIIPVWEIDNRRIGAGEPGPITRRLQDAFADVVRGARVSAHPEWLTFFELQAPRLRATGDVG
jgi:branched-chain amino acid aminotransferase